MSDGYYGNGSGAPFEPKNETLPPEDEKNTSPIKGFERYRDQKVYRQVSTTVIIFCIFIIISLISTYFFFWSFSHFSANNKSFSDFDEGISSEADTEAFSEDGAWMSMELMQFNSRLELYAGTQYSTTIPYLLDAIITNIKKNPDHLIIVNYGGNLTATAEEISELKKQFDHDVGTKYEVLMDYDAGGYIYRVNILNY